MFKKSLTSLLILSQVLFVPAARSDDLLNNILGIIVQTATQNQPPQPDSNKQLGNGAPVDFSKGQEAKSYFGNDKHPLAADKLFTPAGEELFDPSNAEQAKRYKARLDAITKKIGARSEISPTEMLEYTRAMLPYIRHLEGYSQATGSTTLTIPPGREAEVSLLAMSSDNDLIGWRKNNKLHLVSQDVAVQYDIQDEYNALAKLAATNPEYSPLTNYTVSGLLNTIVSMSSARMPSSLQLRNEERRIMDLAMPGGANRLQSWITNQANMISDFKRQGGKLPDYRPEKTNVSDFEYTMLAPGVASKTKNLNNGYVSVHIANTTDKPFEFKPSSYVAIPNDGTSRQMLLGGVNGLQDHADGCYGPKWNGVQQAQAVLNQAQQFLSNKSISLLGAAAFPAALYVANAWHNPQVRSLLKAAPVLNFGLAAYEIVTQRDIVDGHKLTGLENALKIAEMVPLEGYIIGKVGESYRLFKGMDAHAGESVSLFSEFGQRVNSLAASPPAQMESININGAQAYRDPRTGLVMEIGENSQVSKIYTVGLKT